MMIIKYYCYFYVKIGNISFFIVMYVVFVVGRSFDLKIKLIFYVVYDG